MSQVLLFTPPFFRGTISDTPSDTAYHVKPGETIVAESVDLNFLLSLGFTSAAPPANAASPLTIKDGSTSVTNASTIDFTSGATVSSGGAGVANVAVSGGGGGYVFADGIGISTDTITNPGTVTIGNTGTIVLPAATGTNSGLGVHIAAGSGGSLSSGGGILSLYAGNFTGAGTSGSGGYGGLANLYGGSVTLTDPGGYGEAGQAVVYGGSLVSNSGVTSTGAHIAMNGGQYGVPGNQGGNGIAEGGRGYASGGDFIFQGGQATGTAGVGGSVAFNPGTGATIGNVFFNNLGTAGDAQSETYLFINNTSGAASVTLTADGLSAAGANVASPVSNAAMYFTADCLIFDVTSAWVQTFSQAASVIYQGANAASTVIGTNPTMVAGPTIGAIGTLQAIPVIAADTTNGGFKITYQPPTGNTDSIRAMCRIKPLFLANV